MELSMLFNTLIPSAIIAGSLASAATKGVHGWLVYDFTITLMIGISLLVTPQFLLAKQTDVALDQVSLYMGRIVGLFLIANSYNTHHAINTPRKAERLAIVRSRFISAILILVVAWYANAHYHEWNTHHVQITITGSFLWIMMYGYYGFSSFPRHSLSDAPGFELFMMIDHATTLFVGALWLAFPQWILRNQVTIRPNAVSVHIGRILGALLISSSFLSEASTRFPTRKGQNNIIMSRMLLAGTLMLLVICAQLTEKFKALNLFMGVAAAVCWGTNAFFGYIAINYTTNASTARLARSNSSQLLSDTRMHGEGFTVSASKTSSRSSFDKLSNRLERLDASWDEGSEKISVK